jgi:hypothetical protein
MSVKWKFFVCALCGYRDPEGKGETNTLYIGRRVILPVLMVQLLMLNALITIQNPNNLESRNCFLPET